MKTEIIITFNGDYIDVIHNANSNMDVIIELWTKIIAACKKHNCKKILGVSKNFRPLTISESYAHIDLFNNLGIDHTYRIAWVELSVDAIASVKMISDFFTTRGIPGKVFLTKN